MTPHAALTAVASYVTTAAVLPGGCHYPARPAPEPRSGQIVWQAFERADNLGQQVWLLRAAVYLITPRLNESTYDVGSVDPLVVAVADVFDPDGDPDAYHLRTGGDGVDFCRVTAGGAEPFQGHYAFRVDLEIKLRRFAA